MKKQYIIRLSKKIVSFLIVVLFLSFLALPIIGRFSNEVPGLFLENNFDISNVSTHSKINEIYEIEIRESSIEPEIIYIYSGDVLKFLNNNKYNVSLDSEVEKVTIISNRDYFKVFENSGTYVFKFRTLDKEIGSLTVYVK